jgi:invasion protein IalB
MNRVLCAVMMGGALTSLALPASAQQGAAPNRVTQAPARPAAPAAQPPAAPAAPAAQAPAAQPEPIRTEIVKHDNWTVTCREFADKKRSCSGVLQVVQAQNNQTLFVWIIGKNSDGKVMSVLQTPTGVAIAPGVEVKLTRGAARKAVYVNCETNRCEATMDIDEAFSRDASASDNVEATIYSTTGQGVKFTLPFKGFDRALAAVR